MVIVVQDVGTGLIKSTEAYGFIESHSRDDTSDNELRFLHFSPLAEMYISLFFIIMLMNFDRIRALPIRVTKRVHYNKKKLIASNQLSQVLIKPSQVQAMPCFP